MADEQVQKAAPEEGVVVVNVTTTDSPQHSHDDEKVVNEKESECTEKAASPTSTTLQTEMSKTLDDDKSNSNVTDESASFKEETTKVADLPDPERKALQEFKQLLKDALQNHQFSTASPPPSPKQEPKAVLVPAPTQEAPPQEPEKTEPETVDAVEKEAATIATESSEPAQPEAAEEKVAAAPAAVAADDDGAKTVEAIEETIVAVASSVPQEQPAQPKEPVESTKAATLPEAEESKDAKDEAVAAQAPAAPAPAPEEVSIWGVPLLADERSDVILLKFLRARDFKVKDAFVMLRNTVEWRKQFGIEELVDEDLGSDLDKVVFMHGVDKEGHPVCYNVYGEFQSKELYQNTFSDEEKRQMFLRKRIQFLERSIRKFDFTPGGVSTFVQVNDLKNSPGPGKWELRQATKQALQLLQDNYPEFVAKQVFINVPWWYLAVNRMISPFLTQRTKSKFVFAGPSKSADTLLRYIAPEQIPIKYGGLSKDGEFGTSDAVTEIIVRPAAKHTVEFPVTESCVLSWEVRVGGWDVKYGAEFVPNAEESYTVIIQKSRKVGAAEEPVVCNSFKVGEAGKVVLTIDNSTSKKKKLLYRLKTKPCSD
ncbi:patellin-3-like [Humulus lupulus]|uniref:patellin-3-like n=1 Tax=Humulus lupulus TaxID=3486 RepID=UPI002B414942|nr:patellin-3-like [Humulus lupulus]